jgi:hypothetical protein
LKDEEERLCKQWKATINEKWANGQAGGEPRINTEDNEDINGDQIKKAGALVTVGQRRQLLRVLAGVVITSCLAEKRGNLAEGLSVKCKRGKGPDDQRHRFWLCGCNQHVRTDEGFQQALGGVPGEEDLASQMIFTKFKIPPRREPEKVLYEGADGRRACEPAGGKGGYMDGSCVDNSSLVAKAGAGIAQEDEHDRVCTELP